MNHKVALKKKTARHAIIVREAQGCHVVRERESVCVCVCVCVALQGKG